MKIRAYKVIFEDRDNVYREFIPATTSAEAQRFIEGNGEVITISDVTKDCPISETAVDEALRKAGFENKEVDLIRRMIGFFYANAID